MTTSTLEKIQKLCEEYDKLELKISTGPLEWIDIKSDFITVDSTIISCQTKLVDTNANELFEQYSSYISNMVKSIEVKIAHVIPENIPQDELEIVRKKIELAKEFIKIVQRS